MMMSGYAGFIATSGKFGISNDLEHFFEVGFTILA